MPLVRNHVDMILRVVKQLISFSLPIVSKGKGIAVFGTASFSSVPRLVECGLAGQRAVADYVLSLKRTCFLYERTTVKNQVSSSWLSLATIATPLPE